jgi:hypothetical protein
LEKYPQKEVVLTTYKILKEKAFNEISNIDWGEWAVQMIEEGYDSISLFELAGIQKPYLQFELFDLTNKVLKDLQFDFDNKEKALDDYIYYLIKTNINNQEKYCEVLRELKIIYDQSNDNKTYLDFALYYWAKDDLIHFTETHYCIGANRNNIDDLIGAYFKIYLSSQRNK